MLSRPDLDVRPWIQWAAVGTGLLLATTLLTDVSGLALSGADLYTVSRTTGELSVRDWNQGHPGASSLTVSGPSTDGIDWRARSLFAGS